MTDNLTGSVIEQTQKDVEEDPEKFDVSAEVDDDLETLDRYDGSETTDLGGESVSDLMGKVS